MRCASTVSPRVVRSIGRLDDPKQPMAETARRVNAFAEQNGMTRTSYERLRQLIKAHREYRALLGPSAAEIVATSLLTYNYRQLEELLVPREERRKRR
jgi:hypothetical protein